MTRCRPGCRPGAFSCQEEFTTALKQAEREFRAQMALYGLKWCAGCAAFLPIGVFVRDKHNAGGMASRCSACSAAQAARRREDPEFRAEDNARRAQHAREKPELKRARNHRRRARERGNGIVPYREADVWAAYNHACIVCGAPGEHLDHWTAIANGGPDAITNATILCAPCNLSKGARDPLEFLASRGIRFNRVIATGTE